MGFWNWVKGAFHKTTNWASKAAHSVYDVMKGAIKTGKQAVGKIYEDSKSVVKWGGDQIGKVFDIPKQISGDVASVFKSPLTWIGIALAVPIVMKFI